MNKLLDHNESHQYGYLRDLPDHRDYAYADIAPAITDLPTEVDLTYALPHTLSQGNVPSCVGHAVANQIWMEEQIRGIRNSCPSRLYIYTMARLMREPTLTLRGAYPRLAYKGVFQYGCPSEDTWRYSTNEEAINTRPNYRAIRKAASRMGLKYYRIGGWGVADKIRQALANNHPVSIGTNVTGQMRNYKAGGIITAPTNDEDVGGGHFMCLAGYRDNHFICVNSWASKPRFLFHESFVEWGESGDFYVVDGWEAIV